MGARRWLVLAGMAALLAGLWLWHAETTSVRPPASDVSVKLTGPVISTHFGMARPPESPNLLTPPVQPNTSASGLTISGKVVNESGSQVSGATTEAESGPVDANAPTVRNTFCGRTGE